MSDIILETSRLCLVTWDDEDVTSLARLHSTLATTRFMSGRAPWSVEKCAERLLQWKKEHALYGTTKYKLLKRRTGTFLGRAGISFFKAEADVFELGYALLEEEWGRGYATEIADALVAWFFARQISDRLIAFTYPDNLASQHVLGKIGMRPTAPVVIDGIKAPTFETTALEQPRRRRPSPTGRRDRTTSA